MPAVIIAITLAPNKVKTAIASALLLLIFPDDSGLVERFFRSSSMSKTSLKIMPEIYSKTDELINPDSWLVESACSAR
jgi:uncharacterized protein (DUF927 family)